MNIKSPLTTPKAIVLDLDGTLLDNHHTISSYTLDALQAFKNNGGRIVIATGRPPRLVLPILPELELADYFIYYNGAFVTDSSNTSILQQHISNSIAQAIHQAILQEHPHGVILWEVNDEWYANRHLSDVEEQWFLGPRESLMPNLLSSTSIDLVKPYKLLVPHTFDIHERLDAFVDRLNILRLESMPFVEIVDKTVSKGAALHHVIKYLQIQPDELVVFGDDRNDIPMFKQFPHSVAMANAIVELKEISTEITSTNHEHGVALKIFEWLKVSPSYR